MRGCLMYESLGIFFFFFLNALTYYLCLIFSMQGLKKKKKLGMNVINYLPLKFLKLSWEMSFQIWVWLKLEWDKKLDLPAEA